MERVKVNPNVIRWARETAGLSLDDAAVKLQLQSAHGVPPAQRLGALEEGAELPTRPLLLKMSKQYRRPLLVFYLEQPPTKGDRGEDFRRLPTDYSIVDNALVDALVRDIRARQSIVRAVIEEEDELGPLSFVGSMRIEDGIERVCTSIRENIGFDLQVFRARRTVSDAFSYLRSCAESAGIFVLIAGDLGSHHTKLTVEMFRGFALADAIAPFVIVNDQDARAAWSFTVVHELAHIWLGQTGISGAFADTDVERFCNDVAGSILLPSLEMNSLDISDATEPGDAIERISYFAASRNVSRAMVAYKLFRTGKISFNTWDSFRIEFRRQWFEHRDEQRRLTHGRESGPSYYVVRRHRVGDALIGLVSRMMASGALTSTKAGKVLGVKPRNVYELLQRTA